MVKIAAATLGFLALASTVSAGYPSEPWCGDEGGDQPAIPKELRAKTNEVQACIDYLNGIADQDCTAYPYHDDDFSVMPFCISGSSALMAEPVGKGPAFTKPCGTFAKAYADIVKKCARSDGLVSGGSFFTSLQAVNIYNREVSGY